nr:hypothetical protein [Gordonia araii]
MVPFWTLATTETTVPDLISEGQEVEPNRLDDLRSALAAFASSPIVTLEAHPIPSALDKSRGIPLGSATPLAKELADLISRTPAAGLSSSSETLYRMVVPAKVAAEVGRGLVTPMKAASGGVHGALVRSSGIAAQASFVPVAGKAAATGAVGGSAATAAAAGGAVTVAAPLVLMALVVGVSAHAEQKRQQAIEKLTELLEKLDQGNLDKERDELSACRPAIEKATALLLDGGRVGHSLGLDTSVHVIDKGLHAAERRLKVWKRGTATLPNDGKVELNKLREAIPGIDDPESEFYAHLELARLAISLKKRVLVLQAVEHIQLDEANPFKKFTEALDHDQKAVDQLERDYIEFLTGLAAMRLDRSHGLMDFRIGADEVDKLLDTSSRLRELPALVPSSAVAKDVEIEIAKSADGSIVVFPARVTA